MLKAAASRQADYLLADRPFVPSLPDEDTDAANQQRQDNQRRGVFGGQQQAGGDTEQYPVEPQPVAQREDGQTEADRSQQGHGQVGHNDRHMRRNRGIERQQQQRG